MTMDALKDVEIPPRDVLDKMLAKTKSWMFSMPGAGFLAPLIFSHKFVWDETCDTAWCNGTTIGFNPAFFVACSPAERLTLLAHEVYHTGYEHFGRQGAASQDRWNIAADHVINNMLEEQGFVFTGLMEHVCKDPAYVNMSTEAVLAALPPDPPKNQPLGGDLREPEPGTLDQIRENVIQAAQAARMSNEAGSIPGEVSLIIERFLNPKLPWEVLLRQYFTELSHDDWSWKRPSRRYQDEYLPSLSGENGLEHLVYYLDVSGSVSDADVLRFNSEVKHIHETFGPKRLTLVTFDTQIHDIYEFTDDMPFERIVVTGRGGTCLDPVQAHIEATRPTAAIVFTDLCCDPMQADPGSPVLWIVTGNPGASVPFGKIIHIENETETS